MAPMALLDAGRALGRSYADAVTRGLRWISGVNEAGASLILSEQGLVLRDIHRQGCGRLRRMIRGTLWCCGWRGRGAEACSDSNVEINRECRPYELGWLLYAAGSACQEAMLQECQGVNHER